MVVLIAYSLLIAACGKSGGGTDNGNLAQSNDASLSSLALSGAALDQVFQSSQFDYTTDAGFLFASVSVLATTTHASASIDINGSAVISGVSSAAINLIEGSNGIAITLTAEDGTSTQIYNLTVNRETAASFAQQAYVKASNSGADDQFGWSMALSGDTLAVGAYGEASNGVGVNSGTQADDSEDFSGAVYVFTRSGGVWSQQAYIKASNAEANDLFGYSLALENNTLAVGAYGEASNGVGVNGAAQANNTAASSGAVYVFTRTAGLWSQQAYVKASNSEANDRFGWQVALAGDTLAVGAWGDGLPIHPKTRRARV